MSHEDDFMRAGWNSKFKVQNDYFYMLGCEL